MKRRTTSLVLFVICLLVAVSLNQQHVKAVGLDDTWTPFVDISNTPTASTYPCITSDAAGNVLVLWSEDVGGKTRNMQLNPDGSPLLDARGKQANVLTDSGSTLYYTRWDGQKWLDPIDVEINPNGRVQYPQAAVDLHGVLHVVWVATEGTQARLLYSNVVVDKAELVHEWSDPIVLAEPVLYALYPAAIVTDPGGGIHVLYSDVGSEPGAYVVNSFDGGQTWSLPVELYRTYDVGGTQEGVSPTRLVVDNKGRLHATWTRYGADGNGKGIYYAQSQDYGRSWSKPTEVATWQPGWYEVDWLTVGVAGDEIHLVWEGSDAISFFNERISYDGGLTWSEPHRIFLNLRGENGFADLVVDSANILHWVNAQRGDPGSITHGVWYATWDKASWQDPILLSTSIDNLYATKDQLSPSTLQNYMRGTFTGAGLRYPMATIVNGNELFVVVVNEWDGDIWSTHTALAAPHLNPEPYPQPAPMPTQQPVATSQLAPAPTSPAPGPGNKLSGNIDTNAGDPILVAGASVLLLIAGVFVAVLIVQRSHI